MKNNHQSVAGFSLIEVVITLTLLSGSYLVIFSSQQFITSHTLKQEGELRRLIEASNQHEMAMALLQGESE
jgi:prepilin-type N-terminal cleavage/methylation domain-containing protein